MGKLLVVGSLNLDYMIAVERLPAEGETILGKSVELIPGGKGANQAFAAGRLRADVSMIGAVGDDAAGKLLLESLVSASVDVGGVEILAGETSGNAFIPVGARGENNIIVVPGANGRVTPALIDRHIDLIDACDILILQLEIPMESVVHAARLARARGKTVILDPAPAPDRLPDELLGLVDLVKPNETELSRLAGVGSGADPADAARRLIEKTNPGLKVLVTLGAMGSLLVRPEGETAVPGRPVKAVDSTAAGDCYTASLAAALSRGLSLREAMEYATAASALSVTRKGAQSSLPTAEEVDAFLAGV